MNKKYFSVLFLSFSAVCFSQENTVTSGGDATGAGGSVSYSIGQIDYTSNASGTGNVNQGVQQPFELFIEVADIESLQSVGINVYPNPTSEYLILSLTDPAKEMNYQLHDMNGRIVIAGKISGDETRIDMRPMAAGGYMLSINQNYVALESVKITKQ